MNNQKTHINNWAPKAFVRDHAGLSVPEYAARKESPREKMHELFERQAEKTPDLVAVADNHRQLTYAELNRRSNQLAHFFRNLGIGPEAKVGICMRRSVDVIVGLIGILKSGGAYVPLDPAYPSERLRFMLEDSQAAALLTEQQIFERTQLSCAAPVIYWEQGWDQISLESEENLASNTDGENLAYLIYTSGSTGRPKAVGIRHSSVAMLLRWAQETFTPEETAGILGSTSICFDLSVFEIFVPLSRGGNVLVVANALELPNMARRNEVTLINTVPSAMAELLRMNAIPASVQVVNLAGEALPKALVKQVYERTQVTRLFNLYGPSEDTTYSTAAYLSREQVDQEVSIGTPIPGTHAYVLDDNLQLVPANTVGELYLSGAGLARGYVGRPQLTAERFLSDPFSAEAGARMYRTGDLARWRADGKLAFLGRADHQVKLRGYRIELGEIENQLEAHAQIERAVIMVREDHPGDQRLVAYIVKKHHEKELDAEELRLYLKQRLPEYMVPGSYTELERFPLSPNGKIDRKALPKPEIGNSGEARSYVAPRTAIEKHLANTWSELLGIEKISIHDNFFEIGGHSLSAVRVLARVGREYGVDLHLQSFFNAPTIETFSRMLEMPLRKSEPVTSLKPRMKTQALPLSYPQQTLWIVSQVHPSAACYNIAESFHIEGELNVPAVQWALTQIMRRHEALRTRFLIQAGEPVQQVDDPCNVPLPVIDLRHVGDAVREQQAQQWMVKKAREPIQLAKGPLLRALLVRLAPNSYKLMVTIHHIATDGWSQSLLWSELSALYAAFGKTESPLPELPVQYADYALWQRDWIDDEKLQRHLGYWKLQLANMPLEIGLPNDHPRPPIMTFRGAREPLEIDASVLKSLKELGRAQGVTLFMLLLAAFKTLLAQFSSQEDIVVGTPIADRRQIETENLIGFFINTLVLRTGLAGNPRFSDLLQRVKTVALEAHQHQDVPFRKLVEYLGVSPNLNSNPLIQVMFVLENAPLTTLSLPGLQVTSVPMDIGTSIGDLLLSFTEAGEKLTGFLEYSTDLFGRSTIQRMIGHYRALLKTVVANPERGIEDLPLLSVEEQSQLLQEWNRVEGTLPHEKCLHQLFEEQVARTPNLVAVADEELQLTYDVLNRRTNQLAHHLLKSGVQPESRIGVCTRHSARMMIAVLGILKAGAAYVPLDPTYPVERLSFMLQDGKIAVLLTEASISAGDLNRGSHHTLLLDKDWTQIACESEESPRVPADVNTLAYVIYTSDSTGRPKGVQCSHRGVVNLLGDFQRRQPLQPGDRCSLWTSLSFDVSIYEIFSALLFGGALEPAPESLRADAQKMIEWLSARRIKSAYAPPFMLGALCDWSEQHPGNLQLSRLLVGVESIERKLLARLNESIPALKIINGYGPTEASICTILYEFSAESAGAGPVPIGGPVANGQIYILDKRQRPVPTGMIGELYLGGAGLARGYLNHPELTAEKFVPNAFSHRGGERLYRTGDLVKWHADGNLYFVGRADHQVKLRGYRIELGEIENTLKAHRQIEQALVIVWRDQPGTDWLVGYVIKAEGAEELLPNEIRGWLKERLPEYMVPATIVEMEEFPLNPNGKIDRRRLPKPNFASRKEYTGPRNSIEETLCALWADVLKLQRIGVHDNFFDFGGHSLLATQMMSRIPHAFEVDLPVRVLFEAPTVAGFAVRLEQQRTAAPPAASAISVTQDTSIEQMLASLDTLSEDEVELLLNLQEPI
jgi:amino acid adenylation domain-containing protein